MKSDMNMATTTKPTTTTTTTTNKEKRKWVSRVAIQAGGTTIDVQNYTQAGAEEEVFSVCRQYTPTQRFSKCFFFGISFFFADNLCFLVTLYIVSECVGHDHGRDH